MNLNPPLLALVAHFARRLFANEGEQTSGTLGFGPGAAIAIAALPGAFASLFLIDKYSTLLQWMRGVRMDALRASVSDEYFFIVLSMTVTGLVMVMRWNRIFPDRRDFSNLAVLPVSALAIFAANLVTLVGLAALLAIDVNAVSSVLFPSFVAMDTNDSVRMFFRLFVCHTATVLAASVFTFFAAFAALGLLMLVIPRNVARSASILARMAMLAFLLLQFLSTSQRRAPGASFAHSLPATWFLALYEKTVGLRRIETPALAERALVALAIVILVAIAAYALTYRRYFMRIAESPESATGSRRLFRIGIPDALTRLVFRSEFEHTCIGFASKVLLRSEQHVMFFGTYACIGVILAMQAAASAAGKIANPAVPNANYLAVPLILVFCFVSGLRFAFDIPATTDANWVFKIAMDRPSPEPRVVARRLVLMLVIPPELFLLAPVTATFFGWRIAGGHTLFVIALTVWFTEALLLRFRKIPFTCTGVPEIKPLLFRLLGSTFAIVVIIPSMAAAEAWMLHQSIRFVVLAIPLLASWWGMGRYRHNLLMQDRMMTFDDMPQPAFELLKLF